MEYKDTLLMPQTDFKMKGNLAQNESLMREKWENLNLYEKIIEKNQDNPLFVLHDGPPYANGDIHIGHALNKVLKDFINRYKMLSGFKMIYIPGFDVHGLPIETAVTNRGIDRKKTTTSEFRQHCADFANEQIIKQTAQFKKLNVIGDWDNSYVTMAQEFEAKQIEVFAAMTKRGLIFKGLKPVYWSPSSESALAEAEIEYQDRQDYSIYVAFSVVDGNNILEKDDQLIIWTTTPWTLPGNLAIAVGPDFNYDLIKVNNQRYLVASDLKESLKTAFNWPDYQVLKTLKGNELENIKYQHCFMDKVLPVIVGEHVTLTAGTGLVHTAPGYGEDDFVIGRKYNLGMVNGVNDQGYLTAASGEFDGLFYEEANEKIVERLAELNILLKKEKISHSYPHDWRTKKPVIFRATDQWFCSIEKIKKELLTAIENEINWDPSWGKLRMYNMINEREDWCISRQRVWGVPIPIFYNEDNSPILDYDVMMHVANLFREYGSNIWFEKEAKDLLPPNYQNDKSPHGNFTKETDIMDVWFDSGSSHTGVLLTKGLPYPADLYLEGSDQYRGWFNSSLITGVAVHEQAPYKAILSHGFVLDGHGHKMSKSLGNVIDPLKLIRENGSDILRLWVASVDFREDVRISNEMIDQVKENYRKLRNTYRFMLGNLFDFSEKNLVAYDNLKPVDQYVIIELNNLVANTKQAYDQNNFQEVYRLVNNYINFTLSNFYLDFTKDILYIEKSDSIRRRSVQTAIYLILQKLIKIMAVITPYTSEEVYLKMPAAGESVHLETFPLVEQYENEDEILKKFKLFFQLKNDIYKALEEARIAKVIGKSLEAKVMLNVTGEYLELVKYFGADLKQLLIVSELEVTEQKLTKYQFSEVKVEKFAGVRCERCWTYFYEKDMKEDICQRCYEIIGG